MGREIERKFLVQNKSYKLLSKGILYKQGYLCSEPVHVVRVRTIDDKGFITVKGKTVGATRMEYEYEIPFDDAAEMLKNLCEEPLIEKIRYKYEFMGFTWEIDEFLGENEGLVVAEVELQNEGAKFLKPGWIGEEVTFDPRYYNSNLIKKPYMKW